MLGVLCLLLMSIHLGMSMHCHEDEELANVSGFNKTISPAPSDYDYWQNKHMWYYTYGVFSDDPSEATIVGGLHTEDSGNPLFQVKIYCSNKSWKLYARKKGLLTLWRSGVLKTGCVAGAYWDLVLKVEQKRRAFFMFNAEALDNELVKRLNKWNDEYIAVMVKKLPMIVTKGDLYKVKVTDGAAVTRFAYGKCWSIPHEIRWNCTASNEYMEARAKPEDEDKLGLMKVNDNKPTCYSHNNTYWYWQQNNVHVDQNSISNGEYQQYCCCTNMTTGELVIDREVVTLVNAINGDDVLNYYYEYKTCAAKAVGSTSCDTFLCRSAIDYDVLAMYNDVESMKLLK